MLNGKFMVLRKSIITIESFYIKTKEIKSEFLRSIFICLNIIKFNNVFHNSIVVMYVISTNL